MKNIYLQKPSFWSPHGRMRRKTYLILYIPTFLLKVITVIFLNAFENIDSIYDKPILLLFVFLPYIMSSTFYNFITIKRLHDCGYIGWWSLVPFSSFIALFLSPTNGINRFGFDPREDFFDENIEFEKDYSFFAIISLPFVFGFLIILSIFL